MLYIKKLTFKTRHFGTFCFFLKNKSLENNVPSLKCSHKENLNDGAAPEWHFNTDKYRNI